LGDGASACSAYTESLASWAVVPELIKVATFEREWAGTREQVDRCGLTSAQSRAAK
jgi:hypothetical protein